MMLFKTVANFAELGILPHEYVISYLMFLFQKIYQAYLEIVKCDAREGWQRTVGTTV
jgi:hypothetical protein